MDQQCSTCLFLRLEHAESVVAFTGAGMSAESGVPMFRGDDGVWKKFILELTDEDVERFMKENIYFLGVSSPACQTQMRPINQSSTIISFDIDALSFFDSDQYVALLLHEVGHAFNPTLIGREGEFAADDFAMQHDYGKYIISGLEKGIANGLNGFDQLINNERIQRSKQHLI